MSEISYVIDLNGWRNLIESFFAKKIDGRVQKDLNIL